MTKTLLGGAAALAIAIGSAAFAQPTTPVQPAPHLGRGHMMKTETRADAAAKVQQHFAKLDANHDGFITKDEVEARQAKREQRAENRAQHFDPAKMFDRLDANHDGKVTRAEAEAAHSAHMASKDGRPADAHAAAYGKLFERADTNRDGVITRPEFDAAAAQMQARMERAGMHHGFEGKMFEKADANKDGRVSLAEAQQLALTHFDKADINHDGKVTPEERQQLHQQMRPQHRPS